MRKSYSRTYHFFQDRKGVAGALLAFLTIAFVVLFLFPQQEVRGASSVNSSLLNVTLRDQTEMGLIRGTNCSEFCSEKDKPSFAIWNVYVFANFTNLSTRAAVTDGNCTVRFRENQTASYTSFMNMSYNTTADTYVFNRTFFYRGNITWQASCSFAADSSELNTTDNITLTNTEPYIKGKTLGSLPTQSITEDTNFSYNLSENVSEDDLNDWGSLSFSNITGNTTLANFTLTSGGILSVNISRDSDVGAGSKDFVWQVADSSGLGDSAILPFTLTKYNDAPQFGNLNITMNATENINFYLQLNATDEENNTPFRYNVTFDSCQKAPFVANASNCTLFVLNSSTGIINFTASNDDIGNYTLNFTLQDNNSITSPNNNTRNFTVSFTIINVNNAPNITFLCDNTRSTSEDTLISCVVNATDTDENNNLTFFSNLSFFTFNNSLRQYTSLMTNITGSNTTALANISFTTNDSAVGVWYLNVTVNDTANGTASRVINFNVSQVNDSSVLGQFNASYDMFAYAELLLAFNATDDDLRIPAQGKSCLSGCYNETITFAWNITGRNITLFTVVKNGTSVNASLAYLRFTPVNNDSGNYSINITSWDANNFSISSRTFSLSISNNSNPFWNLTSVSFSFSEGSFALNLSSNVTDPESDAITFSDNTSLFDITSSGYIDISTATGNDSFVGNHTLVITLTDSRGADNGSQAFSFRIRNVNETPVFPAISAQNGVEDSLFSLTVFANDEDLDLNTSASDYFAETLTWGMNASSAFLTAAKLNFTVIDNRSASFSFTPNKTDHGNHSITVNVTDKNLNSVSRTFNLSIAQINHQPFFTYIGSPLNVSLNASNMYICSECIDLNVSDVEDGNDTSASVRNFTFFSNETWLNISKIGKVNFSVNQSYTKGAGWFINITVADNATGGSSNLTNSTVFSLTILEYNVAPDVQVLTPASPANMDENSTKSFQVIVSDQNADPPNNDTLTLRWRIDSILNTTQTDVTNNTLKTFTYYTNFTDETINVSSHNITLEVSDTQNLTTLYSWNVTVNHSNAPVILSANISNISASDTSSVTMSCNLGTALCSVGSSSFSVAGYFYDADHADARYNDSINFTLAQLDENCSSSASGITTSVNNDSLVATFSTSSTIRRCFSIKSFDSINGTFNLTSNNFTVNLTVDAPQVVAVPGGGGGGGGDSTRKKPIALKILVPEPVTLFTIDRIVVPIAVQNTGEIDLAGINLSTFSTLVGVERLLSQTYIDFLPVGKRVDLDLTIVTNTNQTGSYEIILTANSTSPKYSDSASFFVNLVELGYKDKVKAQEKIVFLEELLLGNPECLELREVLEQARKAFQNGEYQKSLELSENAIQACKYAVTSKGRTLQIGRRFSVENLVIAFFIALAIILFLFSAYYLFSRHRLRKGR